MKKTFFKGVAFIAILSLAVSCKNYEESKAAESEIDSNVSESSEILQTRLSRILKSIGNLYAPPMHGLK